MDTIKKAMIEALKSSFGIVTTATDSVGISRQTHYNWLKDDPEYAEAVENVNEEAIDFAESKLREKMNGITVQTYNSKGEPVIYEQPPSDTALIFYLKCKGKKRGYVERTEVEHSGQMSITWHEEKTYETKDDISQIQNKSL